MHAIPAAQSLSRVALESVVRTALAEDLDQGNDLTTDAIVPKEKQAHGRFVARQQGVVAGITAAQLPFELLAAHSSSVIFTPHLYDGARIEPGDVIAEIRGPARVVLTGERTALNLLGHLSGIATLTRAYVDAIHGTHAQIIDTRKTLPGLRTLEKYAVLCGGGGNHRFGLYDAILIKDNHLVVAGSIHNAVGAARAHAKAGITIEVEVDTLEQLREALNEPIDAVLLDNMPPDKLREAIGVVREHEATSGKRIHTEASGRVSLETVRSIAQTGVDRISVGRLTHSAPSLDIALDFDL